MEGQPYALSAELIAEVIRKTAEFDGERHGLAIAGATSSVGIHGHLLVTQH